MPKREITKERYEDVIEHLLDFVMPGVDRGPARREWTVAVTRAAQVLGRAPCTSCGGSGQAQVGRNGDICASCYGIGLEIER